MQSVHLDLRLEELVEEDETDIQEFYHLVSKHDPNKQAKPAERRYHKSEGVFETHILSHVLNIPKQHDEVFNVLLRLEQGGVYHHITEDVFTLPWPEKNSHKFSVASHVFVICSNDNDIKATIINKKDRAETKIPASSIVMEAELLLGEEEWFVFDSLCKHSALARDLLSYLEYVLAESYTVLMNTK